MVSVQSIVVGGKYNWKGQAERLIYLGKHRSGNGLWHQFAKIEAPTEVWCEVQDADLIRFEETLPEVRVVSYRAKESDDLEILSIEKWEKSKRCGWFIPSDGHGYYMNHELVSDVSVWQEDDTPRWATGVVWYNT